MKSLSPAKNQKLSARQRTPLSTPTDLSDEATEEITGALNAILADVFALYVKTKNFHWHLSGPHFRDYHLMFDEQADQLFAMTDPVADASARSADPPLDRSAKSHDFSALPTTRLKYVEPEDMLAELCEDNKTLSGLATRGPQFMR